MTSEKSYLTAGGGEQIPFLSCFPKWSFRSGFSDPEANRLSRQLISLACGYTAYIILASVVSAIIAVVRHGAFQVVYFCLVNVSITLAITYSAIHGVQNANRPCCCGCGGIGKYFGWCILLFSLNLIAVIILILAVAIGGVFLQIAGLEASNTPPTGAPSPAYEAFDPDIPSILHFVCSIASLAVALFIYVLLIVRTSRLRNHVNASPYGHV